MAAPTPRSGQVKAPHVSEYQFGALLQRHGQQFAADAAVASIPSPRRPQSARPLRGAAPRSRAQPLAATAADRINTPRGKADRAHWHLRLFGMPRTTTTASRGALGVSLSATGARRTIPPPNRVASEVEERNSPQKVASKQQPDALMRQTDDGAARPRHQLAAAASRPRSAPAIRATSVLDDAEAAVVGHTAAVFREAASRGHRATPPMGTFIGRGRDGAVVEGHAPSVSIPWSAADMVGRPPAFADISPALLGGLIRQSDRPASAKAPRTAAAPPPPQRPQSAHRGLQRPLAMHYVTPDPGSLGMGLQPAIDTEDAIAKLGMTAAHNPVRLRAHVMPTVYKY